MKIYLPASDRPGDRPERATDLIRGNGRILFMDDEEAIRNTAGPILNYLGYQVSFARDGAEAIDLYKKAKKLHRPFDLAIIDLTIPGGMGGKETIRRLREIDSHIKALVSSGYPNDPVLTNYQQYGFCGVLRKPYKIEELNELLHTLLS